MNAVHLSLSKNAASYGAGSRGCSSEGDTDDARAVAERLRIPFEIWDFAEEFHRDVVTDFISEYEAGRTPNPCLRCNEKIKFAALLNRGVELGYDKIATGHYADLRENPDGTVSLYRATDFGKDQSYVLGKLTQEQLARCLFPLHNVEKSLVREEAETLGLDVASKPDSHDICFIPDGDTQGFLSKHLGDAPGDIIDEAGTVLGQHQGHHRYTIGQRKGLNLRVPSDDGSPRFVLRIEPKRNAVVVGPRESLAVQRLRGIRPTWTEQPVEGRWRGIAQFRAHGTPMPATFEAVGDEVLVTFDEPAHGVAPGQSVVAYNGDRVVGSAVIAETR